MGLSNKLAPAARLVKRPIRPGMGKNSLVDCGRCTYPLLVCTFPEFHSVRDSTQRIDHYDESSGVQALGLYRHVIISFMTVRPFDQVGPRVQVGLLWTRLALTVNSSVLYSARARPLNLPRTAKSHRFVGIDIMDREDYCSSSRVCC